MEKMGLTMKQVSRQIGITQREFCNGVQMLIRALQSLHNIGYVHNDVKPSNAVMGAQKYVYLIDFGLASQWKKGNNPIKNIKKHPAGTSKYLSINAHNM